MAQIEPKSIIDSIEIIRAVQPLFTVQNPYLPMYGALGGAFIGAMAAFIPNYLLNRIKDRNDKRTTTLQIYAEIKVTLELLTRRKYIEHLERICAALATGEISSYTYQVFVPDDLFPVFKSSLPRLGQIDIELQIKIIEFYQLLEAVIQDVRPGGFLNAQPAGIAAYEETLILSKRVMQIGEDILVHVGKIYRLPMPTVVS